MRALSRCAVLLEPYKRLTSLSLSIGFTETVEEIQIATSISQLPVPNPILPPRPPVTPLP